ncbi:hypothetical protein Drorol1_Dr00017865 [Drosera rotundifolia]
MGTTAEDDGGGGRGGSGGGRRGKGKEKPPIKILSHVIKAFSTRFSFPCADFLFKSVAFPSPFLFFLLRSRLCLRRRRPPPSSPSPPPLSLSLEDHCF